MKKTLIKELEEINSNNKTAIVGVYKQGKSHHGYIKYVYMSIKNAHMRDKKDRPLFIGSEVVEKVETYNGVTRLYVN